MGQREIPGKESRAIIRRNVRAIVNGHQAGLYGVSLAGGAGVRVRDVDGNEYLDFLAGASVVTLGYGNEEIINIYRSQAREMHHACYPYSPSSSAVAFAEALCDTFPGPPGERKVLFALSGSQANHAALMCARGFTGKRKIISFKNTWHGSHGLAKEVTYFGHIAESEPGPHEIIHLDFPSTAELAAKSLARTAELLANNDVAAIILECIQGDGGNVVPFPGALEALAELAQANGAIVIIDEVQSGNGRSGKYWEVEHFNIIPDLITTAKGLTSGYYPLAAVVGRADVLEGLPRLAHLNTFTANPVACAIAVHVLKKITHPEFLPQVNRVAELLRNGLEQLVKKYSFFKEVRGLGLHLGLEVKTDTGIDAALFGFLCLQEGLFVGYFGLKKEVVRLHPPLIITPAEIATALQIMEFCAKKIADQGVDSEVLAAYQEYAVGLDGKDSNTPIT